MKRRTKTLDEVLIQQKQKTRSHENFQHIPRPLCYSLFYPFCTLHVSCKTHWPSGPIQNLCACETANCRGCVGLQRCGAWQKFSSLHICCCFQVKISSSIFNRFLNQQCPHSSHTLITFYHLPGVRTFFRRRKVAENYATGSFILQETAQNRIISIALL